MTISKARRRVVVGDVVEIDTGERGLAYAQYTNRHSLYGALIRVLPGVYRSRPDVAALVKRETRYWVFFPLARSINVGLVAVVGNFALPLGAEAIPPMKSRGLVERDGHVRWWGIVNGDRRDRVIELTPEQRGLPTRQVINHAQLLEWLRAEYSPEDDVR